MVTSDLVRYVQQKLERGSSPEKIRQALESQGWPKSDVYEAMQKFMAPDIRDTLLDLEPQAPKPFLSQPTLAWIFRIGLAGVFLVNSVVALVDPISFVKLMQGSLIGHFIHSFAPFTALIAINDGLLGLLILSGRWQSYVLAWSGIWLLAVTVVKLTALSF